MQLARLLENFDPYPAFSRHDAAVNPPIPRRQSRSFLPSAVTRSPLRSNPVGYRDNHTVALRTCSPSWLRGSRRPACGCSKSERSPTIRFWRFGPNRSPTAAVNSANRVGLRQIIPRTISRRSYPVRAISRYPSVAANLPRPPANVPPCP
jgi:hypothetical protein